MHDGGRLFLSARRVVRSAQPTQGYRAITRTRAFERTGGGVCRSVCIPSFAFGQRTAKPDRFLRCSVASVMIRDRRFDDRPPSELFSKQVSPIAICQLGTRIGRMRGTGDTRAGWDGERVAHYRLIATFNCFFNASAPGYTSRAPRTLFQAGASSQLLFYYLSKAWNGTRIGMTKSNEKRYGASRFVNNTLISPDLRIKRYVTILNIDRPLSN
jgi:hypothetical protein